MKSSEEIRKSGCHLRNALQLFKISVLNIDIWSYNVMKCRRNLIFITPSLEDGVICWYSGFTFHTVI